MRIDAHQHFWQYDPVEYDWIDASMKAIAKDQLPADLKPLLEENKIDSCVAVQARQTEAETMFLLDLADQNSFVTAVVGWVDLKAENLRQRLEYYAQFPKLKGFRHVLQGEEPSFMLQPEFLRGIEALAEFDFCYDILVFPRHLAAAVQLVKQFPQQTFILDHLAKPFIRTGKDGGWKAGFEELSKYDNVSCKISGLVTEADWNDSRAEIFQPYIQHALNCFGVERLMFGSDWPVCEVAASYKDVVNIFEINTQDLSHAEKGFLWGENARRIYRIE